MLGTLKERLTSRLGGRRLGPGPPDRTGPGRAAAREAGAAVLTHYQQGWTQIHCGAEQAARQADRADREIKRLVGEYQQQVELVSRLTGLLGELPALDTEVGGLLDCLARLENTFMEVELDLLALEDTIDARVSQERQLEQRFQLAMYQERRRQELEELEAVLETRYQRTMRERQLERQAVFQARFEEDLTRYSTGLLEVPRPRPTDVSLESIDLDGEEGQLELFLREDCPDLSPLPRDEVPVVRSDSPACPPPDQDQDQDQDPAVGSSILTPSEASETDKQLPEPGCNSDL